MVSGGRVGDGPWYPGPMGRGTLLGAVAAMVSTVACLEIPSAPGSDDATPDGDGARSPDASTCAEIPDWWDCDYRHRSRLTFDNSGQDEDLLDFPLLVALDDARLPRDQVQEGGQDLRFIDPDGTVLPHEIERWKAAGTSILWVKVPKIDASSTTDHVWMYHGNPDAPDGQDAAAVWAEALSVWHMGDDPSAPAPQIKDSSATGNHGTAGGSMAATQQMSGRLGGAVRFDGVDDRIVFGAIGSTNLTIEAWVNPLAFANGTNPDWVDMILSTGDGYGSGPRIMFAIHGNRTLELKIKNTSGGEVQLNSISTLSKGAWRHVVGVQDASSNKARIYIDGQLERELPISNIGVSTAPWWMGAMNNGTYPFRFTGLLDEVRLSSVARSTAWIRAQYLSMTDAFVSYAPSSPGTSPPR
jgi:hypothetical protein